MPEVLRTEDFIRIQNLPRRQLSLRDAEVWGRVFTDELRLPGSSAALFPWQGCSLAECVANGGGYLALPVGQGKTLITFLLPTVLKSQRPLLLLPAQGGVGLRQKTFEDYATYLPHWKAPRTPAKVWTLGELAPESGAGLLDGYKPDLIMIDEADDLANPQSSAARRLHRYILANPDVVVVLLTGTPGRKSILDYWHQLVWALGDRAPVPMAIAEARMWALALDLAKGRSNVRVDPGPLGPTQEAAREWYRARLAETPGVVIVDGDSCNQPLEIRIQVAREDPILDQVFERFAKDFETPGGEFVSDQLSRWRLDGQLGCGAHTYFDPPPPDAWRDARRALAKFVRDRISHSMHHIKPLDSEKQVMRKFADHEIVKAWLAVKDTYNPDKHRKVRWVTDSTIQSVRDWLSAIGEPGIVWTGFSEFGQALSHATRLPLYASEGKDQAGRLIRNADPRRSLIASWHACKRGFNLQAWRHQLLVMPPQSAKYLEQTFGRSHRNGQDRPVIVTILATSGGTLDAFETAVGEAGFGRDTYGISQKILRAEIARARPQLTKSNRYRWAQKDAPREAASASGMSARFQRRIAT